MSIFEAEKIYFFVLFVIPGFVALRVYDLFYPSERIDGIKRIVEAVSYSCISYAMLSPLIVFSWPYLTTSSTNYYATAGLSLLFLIVGPILVTVSWHFFRMFVAKKGLIHHPVGKPWDYVFSSKPPSWVKVYMKNGDIIAGFYGTKSFASSAPNAEALFLEEVWHLNDSGGFDKKKARTTGILISPDIISHIDFRSVDP